MEVVTIRNREDPRISLFLFQPYMQYFFFKSNNIKTVIKYVAGM